jgi:hypothetical protein
MPPNGYTLLPMNSQNAINVALYEKLSFDFVRDIAPVGGSAVGGAASHSRPGVSGGTYSYKISRRCHRR